jgi:ubiquinone/menaquinone biosynthesis C-methylase UbiE
VPDYQMEQHWSSVGQHVHDRPDGNLLAGDDSPYYRYKAALFSRKFLPKIPIDGLSLLDVGCGPGGTLHWMSKQHPKRLTGVDQSTEMVASAKRNVPEAEVVQIDGENLPFSDKEFDVVTTVTVLHHNPDARREAILSEICRVSGSQIFLFEDTSKHMPLKPNTGGGAYQNFYGRPVGWYAGVCNTHGFDLVETEYLENYVSRRVELFLSAHLNPNNRTEGTPISRWHNDLEKVTLPLTIRLDKIIKNAKGENTMMQFRRRNAKS